MDWQQKGQEFGFPPFFLFAISSFGMSKVSFNSLSLHLD